jgi:hypothetical protein
MNDKPRNIFEAINLNIVDLSKDVCLIAKQIEEIHAVLYPKNLEEDEQQES